MEVAKEPSPGTTVQFVGYPGYPGLDMTNSHADSAPKPMNIIHIGHTHTHRKASVRLGSFRFVETSNRDGSVHQQAGSFRFA